MSEAQNEESQSTALVVIEKSSAREVFTSPDKLQSILDLVRQAATADTFDVTTKSGQDAIRALAYKIKRTKTFIDGLGKEEVEELKDLPKKIDAGRKKAREYLDALHDEVRKPLTDLEAEQARKKQEEADRLAAIQARKQSIQNAIDHITRLPLDLIGKSHAAIADELEQMEAAAPTADDFDDRLDEATERWTTTVAKLRQMAEQQEAIEKQEQIERDRLIAEQAAENERRRAEQAVENERRRAEQQLLDAKLAERAAEQARIDAEQRAQAAERQAAAERERAQQEAQQAAERAAAAERQRLEAERAAQQRAEAKRAADVEHRKKINNEAVNALVTHAGLSIPQARSVIMAIAKGQIENVKINY